jgi:hypothetical protein
MGELIQMFPPTLLTLENAAKLHYGFARISFEEFAAVLHETIGARDDYARGCWPQFNSGYLGYCFSREPIKQGEALFALAMKKSGLNP